MIRRYIIEADDSLKGFDEAIEKLEREWGAEEIETAEDCISREEFERRIKPYDTEDKTDKALYNFAHNTLIGCPSVQPQPKRGKWIASDTKEEGYDIGGYKSCISKSDAVIVIL